jgi:hypothetical protein
VKSEAKPITGADVRQVMPALAVMGWVTIVLALDQLCTQLGQLVLGVATWMVLGFLLWRSPRLLRVQVGIVVVFATVIEYVFSPLLDVYTYRLGGVLGVPSFVPPGHGLVYFAAVTLGTSTLFLSFRKPLIISCIVVGGLYSLWGLFLSPQSDALGAFWYGCLVLFLIFGKQQLVYVGAFLVVTYLELVGTYWGVWRWSTVDPTGVISIGNPPSGAAGGYGWFDLAAITFAPGLVRRWDLWRAGRKNSERVSMEQPVRGDGTTSH